MVRRLTTDLMVIRSIPSTGHIRCVLQVNQPIYVESTFNLAWLLAHLCIKESA